MNRNFITGMVLVFLCVMTLSSCYDKDLFDSDKLSESVEWQPNWVVPVGYAKYKVWDLLDQHDPTADIQNIDNVITLVHRELDIFSFKADEVIDIPSTQDEKNVGIVIPESFEIIKGVTISRDDVDGIPITEEFTLQDETDSIAFSLVESGISLTRLVADFSMKLEDKSVPFKYDIEIEFPDIIHEGTPYKVSFSRERNDPHINSFNLKNAEINFGEGNSIKYKVKVTLPAQTDVSFVDVEKIDLLLTLENFDFKRAEGDFGNRPITLGTGNFDMDVDLWNEVDGNFEFADPKVKLTVHNHNIGVPFEVDANFIGFNKEGESVNIKKDDGSSKLQFEGIKNPAETDVVETKVYDNENSKIVELFALPPDERIEYSGVVNLNPDASAPANNFIESDAEISLDAEIEVPLHFKAQGLEFRDTITDLDLDIDSDKTDNIKKAAVAISYKSEIPLDVEIEEIFFLDRNMQRMVSLPKTVLLKSPQVDDEGNITGQASGKSIIELTEEAIDKLDETEHIEIVAKASTSEDGSKSVKIPADAIIDFNLVFEVQLDLSNK